MFLKLVPPGSCPASTSYLYLLSKDQSALVTKPTASLQNKDISAQSKRHPSLKNSVSPFNIWFALKVYNIFIRGDSIISLPSSDSIFPTKATGPIPINFFKYLLTTESLNSERWACIYIVP